MTAQEPSHPVNETAFQDSSESRTAVPIEDILTSDLPIGYSPGRTTLQGASGPFLNDTTRGTSGNVGSHPIPQYLSFVKRPHQITRRQHRGTSCHETDLLRHFRYHVGPWIDVGDPDCALGVQVLLLSRSNRPLQAAILALSAGQRSLLSSPLHNEDIDSSIRFRKEAEESLPLQPESVRIAGQALLILQSLLPYGIDQWRAQIEPLDGFVSPTALTEELGEALFWLYFRLGMSQRHGSPSGNRMTDPSTFSDLAASIATGKSPITPFRSFLQRDGSPIHGSQPAIQPQTVHRVYNHALCLLGHSLALIYGNPDVTSPQAASAPELAAFPSLRQSHFLSQWTFLWTDCQKWYNERPVDAQQIVDVRGGEADQIDPDHASSFPILIYTTPMALVANAVYHITSLLLLAHKPRLLKSLPGPRCLTSHIWHAQSIAGIAANNDSPEQWDPILVAGLLLIAREMTHESQQTVLLERMRRITATTGINLERETETLQSVWRIARYDEESEEETADNTIMS